MPTARQAGSAPKTSPPSGEIFDDKTKQPVRSANDSVITLQAERRILLIRSRRVMLDSDLTELYGVETKALNQAVRRNVDRFPEDFMFQLSEEETANLRSQLVTSTSSTHGGRRYLPHAFTEQGVSMRSSVLRSRRSRVSQHRHHAYLLKLRQMLATHADLARKIEIIEKKYDAQFKVVFDAIRQLMIPSPPSKREIGFHTIAAHPKPSQKRTSRTRH